MPSVPYPITEWIRGKEIGKGKFGTVYLGMNKDNKKLFAIKSVDKSDKEKRMALLNERKAMVACDSKYVVQYLGSATSKAKNSTVTTLDLFMELVPRGSVLDWLQRNRRDGLSERLVAAYTRDVLHGLKHLHDQGIVHGDIRCANFLIGARNIKLCDLGSAKFVGQDYTVKSSESHRIFVTGSEGWMAPEVLDEVEQDTPSDIYSLGCSVVEMCTGNPPEADPVIYQLVGPHAEDLDDFSFPKCTVDIPPTYSEHCRDFVDCCFPQHPDDRPSADALMGHSWIVNAPPYPRQAETVPSPPPPKSTISFKNMLGCGPSKR